MHDPDVVVFELPAVTVWHHEPGGRDSGTVCRGMRGTGLCWHNAVWAARHWRHLHFQVHPIQRVKHRFERCAECHRRMGGSTRFGYQGGDGVYHHECMTLRSVQGELDDLTRYALGIADPTAQWRVRRRLAAKAGRFEVPS